MKVSHLVSAIAAFTLFLIGGCVSSSSGGERTLPTNAPTILAGEVHHPIRLLVVTGGHPYDEQQFLDMFNSLDDVEITSYVLQDHSELFENIDGWAYDAAVFYNMTQEMSDLRAENFLKLTEWGVGLVPLHHGTLSWPARPEVKQIFGVEFPDAGPFGFHIGETVTYHIADSNHPITDGLSDWEAIDETYTNYYGKGVPGNRVLITTDHDSSDPELVWVRQWNNSRIANIQGGHDRLQFENEGFRELLERSIYWVSGRLPEEIGGEAYADTTIYREQFEIPAMLQGLADFDAGESRLWQTRAEEVLEEREYEPSRHVALLDGIVEIALSEEPSREARSWALRTLGAEGFPDHLERIAVLLNDPEVGHMACYALEYTSYSAEAAEILRANIGDATGQQLHDIIGTLGREKDAEAVRLIVPYLKDQNLATMEAAANALANIGDDKSIKKLVDLYEIPTDHRRDISELALLAVAATANKDGSREIYYMVFNQPGPATDNRAAALRSLLELDQDIALFKKSLDSGTPSFQTAAIDVVPEIKNVAATNILAQTLTTLSPQLQIAAIYALERTNDPIALPAITNALQGEDLDVRLAAAYAIGSIGNAEAAKTMLAKVSGATGVERDALLENLAAIPDDNVNPVLIEAANTADGEKRVAIIGVLKNRYATEALPSLVSFTEDSDKQVRRAALDAISELGSIEHVSILVSAVSNAKSKSEQRASGKALVKLCGKIDDKKACLDIIAAALGSADEEISGELITAIASLRTNQALETLVPIARTGNGESRADAVRALGDWPTADPIEELFVVAQEAEDARTRALAIRGYLQLADALADQNSGQTLELAKQIQPLLDSADLHKRLVSVISKLPNPESLEILVAYLDNENVAAEAANGIIQLSEPLSYDSPIEVTGALNAVADAPVSEDVKEAAKGAVGGLSEYGDRLLASWGFLSDTEEWEALNQSELSVADGCLHIESKGDDPFIAIPVNIPEQPMILKFRAKYDDPLLFQFFIATDELNMGEEGSFISIIPENKPGEWVDYEVKFTPVGNMIQFRFDPGVKPGTILVDYIRLIKDVAADQQPAS